MTEQTFAATEQVREFGERATNTGRHFGRLAVETYEQAVNSAVEFERATADAVPVEWVKSALNAHASFVADLNAAYVQAVRSVLN